MRTETCVVCGVEGCELSILSDYHDIYGVNCSACGHFGLECSLWDYLVRARELGNHKVIALLVGLQRAIAASDDPRPTFRLATWTADAEPFTHDYGSMWRRALLPPTRDRDDVIQELQLNINQAHWAGAHLLAMFRSTEPRADDHVALFFTPSSAPMHNEPWFRKHKPEACEPPDPSSIERLAGNESVLKILKAGVF
jgi:hypothetical protein